MNADRRRFVAAAVACCLAVLGAGPATAGAPEACVVKSEFIVDQPPVPSSHASTIVETPDGLLAAWFGGTAERSPDVSIWLSRNDGAGWSAPVEVANGVMPGEERRYPCWNPVLFQRSTGQTYLFYKVGPSPVDWWGMVRLSNDNGKTWVKSRRLPGGFIGPVRNKPVELNDGTILCGASTENEGWRVHMEWCHDPFGLWNQGPVLNKAVTVAAIQPTILVHEEGLQILCRTKQGRVYQAWGRNGYRNWNPMDRTVLPNPNSAIDAVMLQDKRALLVYNHSATSRGVINVAVSPGGREWLAAAVLEQEPGAEFSYPAVIQSKDGLVHATYTWKRQKIRHVVIDPKLITPRAMPDGRWP